MLHILELEAPLCSMKLSHGKRGRHGQVRPVLFDVSDVLQGFQTKRQVLSRGRANSVKLRLQSWDWFLVVVGAPASKPHPYHIAGRHEAMASNCHKHRPTEAGSRQSY